MLESFALKESGLINYITAIESKNQLLICSRAPLLGPCSVYTLHKNVDGTVDETRMDAPCQHGVLIRGHNLVTVVQSGKELLAVLCTVCNDIKLVDIEIKQVTSVYKSPVDKLIGMCRGPDGGLFVMSYSGNILQLSSSNKVTNTFDLSSFITMPFLSLVFNVDKLCHLPTPHNTLVVTDLSNMRAVSLQAGHQVWRQSCEGFIPNCLLFILQQDVLLVSNMFDPQVRVLNPSDGSILQIIEVPNINRIYTMCLCNDQIVMIQKAENILHMLVSYYNIKRVS